MAIGSVTIVKVDGMQGNFNEVERIRTAPRRSSRSPATRISTSFSAPVNRS